MAGRIAGSTPDLTTDAAARHDWSRARGLELMRAAFDDATTRTGTVERWFRICGLPVRTIFAGETLVPTIEPALAHLAADAAPYASLTARIWDSATSGVPVPRQPDAAISSGNGRSAPGSIRSSYMETQRILSLYDREAREAVVWVPDARLVPSNEVASPLRTLLHWWARDNGFQFVHAGAVGHEGRAVLLAGPSGAGKSTTTLAALVCGLDYLGDDYVLIDAGSGRTIHSLFSAAKLQPEQVAAFPELRPTLTNADRLASEKALWFVHRDYPERTRSSAEAVAVLVPRITGSAGSTIVPIGRGTALAALAPSTIVQLSGADQWSLDAMAAFLARVPAYRLECGTDLQALAATLRDFISGAAA